MRFLTGIKRRKYGLKKKLRKEWLAISVHSSERLYPPSFDEKGGYVDRIIGGIVPMKLLSNGELALYKIVEKYYKSGDWLYDTDGYTYDMEFVGFGKFSDWIVERDGSIYLIKKDE